MTRITESESDIRKKGYLPLDAKEIESHIFGKTFLGFFPPYFRYIILFNENGGLEGKNNYQHYDTGKWVINSDNTLSVSWNFGWENTTNHVYFIDGNIKFFDVGSGKMNTYFERSIETVESIKAFDAW